MRRPDPHHALLRLLRSRYPELQILEARTEPWESATFSGMRHLLTCASLDLPGLADAEFELPNHVLVDVHVEQHEATTLIEALTIEP